MVEHIRVADWGEGDALPSCLATLTAVIERVYSRATQSGRATIIQCTLVTSTSRVTGVTGVTGVARSAASLMLQCNNQLDHTTLQCFTISINFL